MRNPRAPGGSPDFTAAAADLTHRRTDVSTARRLLAGAVMSGLAGWLLAAASVASAAPSFSTPAEQCIIPAAQYHQVNPYLLRAILRVESSLNPRAVTRNSNGTIDVGISQINSIHFRELAGHGIAPQDLQNACVGTYVGAWHLARVIAKHGNTWEGVARYHSATPAFNRRYQARLWAELLRSGALSPPPAARPAHESRAAAGDDPLTVYGVGR